MCVDCFYRGRSAPVSEKESPMSHVSFRRFGSVSATGRSPLSDDQLRGLAPSAFAVGKHESRSERYTYIPTSAVIDGLRANGFAPTFAKQGRSRIAGCKRRSETA